jgi:hypothetical protein
VSLRTGHGKGAGVPRIEVLPPDELPAATPAATAPIERKANGTFAAGNTVARSKRFRVGKRGFTGLDSSDPRYAKFARWGRSYAAHRRRELALAHGGKISAGVGALVESASIQLAASRFVQVLAAESADPALFKQASSLSNDARQNELAAWELAAREAKVSGESIETTIAAQQRAFQRRLVEGTKE